MLDEAREGWYLVSSDELLAICGVVYDQARKALLREKRKSPRKRRLKRHRLSF